MKNTIMLGRICAAALLWSGAALAVDASGLLDSAQLKEKKVTDLHGSDLGQVDRLILEGDTGRVRYVVIGIGSPANPAEREIVVPWREVRVERQPAQDIKLILNATPQQVQQAPAFKVGDEERLATSNAAEAISSYWSSLTPPGPHRNASGAPFTPGPGEASPQTSPRPANGQNPPGQVSTEDAQKPAQGASENYYEKNQRPNAPSAADRNNFPAGEATSPTENTPTPGSPLRPESRPDTPGTGNSGIPVPGVGLPDQSVRSLDQAADQDSTPAPPQTSGE